MNRTRLARCVGLLLLFVGFLPLLLFAGDDLFDFVDALVIAVGAGVVVAYAPGIARALTSDEPWTGEHYLVLGVVLAWISLPVRHGWQWVWRYLGRPDAMMDTPWLALVVYLSFVGGALHLAAMGAIKGGIPKGNWIKLGVVVAAGLMLAFCVVWAFDPDVLTPR